MYSYEQIGQVCVSFSYQGNLQPGELCKCIAHSKVAPCTEEEAFCGQVLNVRNNCVTVAVRGFVTVPYSGAIPRYGHCPLAADSEGGVMLHEGAKEFLVVQVDSSKKTVTFLL